MFLVAWPSFAADLNGYTAEHECRAGGAYCNVDVASLGKRACDQTIKTSTSWSSINWSNNTICIEAGDHTSKGTLTIPSSANGKPGSYKVLRYYRADDSDDEPWKQSVSSRATIRNIDIQGGYWIIHRLSFDSDQASVGGAVVELDTGTNCTNNILNRILVEDFKGPSGVRFRDSCSYNTLQNSVIRGARILAGEDNNNVDIDRADHTHIVNNELIDSVGGIGTEDDSCSTNASVYENNDIYKRPELFTNCSGAFTPGDPNSPCIAAESIIHFKCGPASGTSNTTKVIHNRMWNMRDTDKNVCCLGGTNGQMVSISTDSDQPASNILFQNNILSDGQIGFLTIRPGHQKISIIGNLLYKIRKYNPNNSSHALNLNNNTDTSEIYLNTVVSSDEYWGKTSSVGSDWRCNVFLEAGNVDGSTAGSGTQFDNNVFYGTSSFATGSNNVDKSLTTRTNSKAYSLNQIIRTSSSPTTACINGGESACFLYKVIQAGVSSNSAPSYCTTLGCTVTDGGMIVQAIRGPYTYRRKLLTVPGGEPVAIPYVRPYVDPNNILSSVPEVNTCPSNYAGRAGIGINDRQ